MNELFLQFFESWQVKTIIGLIVVDLGLGIALSIRENRFEWSRLADFYRSRVIPYIIGYLVLFSSVRFIIPPDIPGNEIINEAAVTLAWFALVANLAGELGSKLSGLYQNGRDTE